jgi:hypothetical protein
VRKQAHRGAWRLVLALPLVLGPAIAGGSPAWADFRAGSTAYAEGDFVTAAQAWRQAAEDGDPAAMRNLGHLYRWGQGVPRDPAEAAQWYRRAAERGLDRAMINLAVLYLDGEGVAADPAAAALWLDRAAALGNTDAMVRLAILTERGIGVAADPDAARRLMERAAALGDPKALSRLEASQDHDVAAAPAAPAEAAPAADPQPPAPTPAPAPAPRPSHSTETRPPAMVGRMIHLGAHADRAAAERAWRDMVAEVPALGAATPYFLPGYVPGRGDLVRLYAQVPEAELPALCAALADSGRPCELHRFFR